MNKNIAVSRAEKRQRAGPAQLVYLRQGAQAPMRLVYPLSTTPLIQFQAFMVRGYILDPWKDNLVPVPQLILLPTCSQEIKSEVVGDFACSHSRIPVIRECESARSSMGYKETLV